MKNGIWLFSVAALLVVSACRTSQKTTEQTDSLAVRVSVQDSTRRDIQFHFDELDMWMANLCDSVVHVAQPKPYVAHLKIRNVEYKRQEENKSEVLQDVVEEHTKSTQKILKPPRVLGVRCLVKLVIGFFIFLFFILYTLRARRR